MPWPWESEEQNNQSVPAWRPSGWWTPRGYTWPQTPARGLPWWLGPATQTHANLASLYARATGRQWPLATRGGQLLTRSLAEAGRRIGEAWQAPQTAETRSVPSWEESQARAREGIRGFESAYQTWARRWGPEWLKQWGTAAEDLVSRIPGVDIAGEALETGIATLGAEREQMARQWERRAGQAGPLGAAMTAAEQVGGAAFQALQEGGIVGSELLFGYPYVVDQPAAREVPVKELYPLAQVASSLAGRDIERRWAELKADPSKIWRPRAMLQGRGVGEFGQAAREAVEKVAAAKPEDRLAVAQQVAAESYSPLWQIGGELIADPLNVIGLVTGPTKAHRATAALRAAERSYLLPALENARAIDQVTSGARAAGRFESLIGDWGKFVDRINPLALTPESKAGLEAADTYLITHNLIEDAGSTVEARRRLDLFRTDPAAAAREFGDFAASERGRQAAAHLQDVDLDGLEFLNPARPYSAAAAAAEIHQDLTPLLEARHGVKERRGYAAMAQAFKGLASEFYMNLNPVYAIRNAGSAFTHLAWDGIMAWDSQDDLDAFLEVVNLIPARIRMRKGTAVEALQTPSSRLPGVLGRASEAGKRLATASPIGEEVWYKRAFVAGLRRTLGQTWHSGARVPDLPPALLAALGDRAEPVIAAVRSGLNGQEIVANTRRVLNPRGPGDLASFLMQYMDQPDALSPALLRHLQGNVMDSRTLEQALAHVDEARARVIEHGDLAYRRDPLEPSRIVFTQTEDAEVIADFGEDLAAAARAAGVEDPRALRLIEAAQLRLNRLAEQIRQIAGQRTQEAAALIDRGSMEIMYQANRRQGELMAEARATTDKMREAVRAQIEANPRMAGALWEGYFTEAGRVWEQTFRQRLEILDGTGLDLQRLAAGEQVEAVTGRTVRHMVEQRNARMVDLEAKAGRPVMTQEEILKRGADLTEEEREAAAFEQRLETLRSRVDLAEANAWRVAMKKADQDGLDILDAADRHVQALARKWRAESDALRREFLETMRSKKKPGKKEAAEIKDAYEKWASSERGKYRLAQDELALDLFGQQAARFELAEQELRFAQAGGGVPPPERPQIVAPTPFFRQPVPEGLTPPEAALWEYDQTMQQLAIVRADMQAGRRATDTGLLGEILARANIARDRAAVEARRGLGELAEATHSRIRAETGRWALDIYRGDNVIKTEEFTEFVKARRRQEQLNLARRVTPAEATQKGQALRSIEVERRLGPAVRQTEAVREWARSAGDQGATAARVKWDPSAEEWALEFIDDSDPDGVRIVQRHIMGRNKADAERAAGLAGDVLEETPAGPIGAGPEAPTVAQAARIEGEIPPTAEELVAEDWELAQRLIPERPEVPEHPRDLDEAAEMYLGRRLAELEADELEDLAAQLERRGNEAHELSIEGGVEEAARREAHRPGESLVEVGGKTVTKRSTRVRSAKWQRERAKEIRGGLGPKAYQEQQEEIAGWYYDLAGDARAQAQGLEAPPRPAPAWLEGPPAGVAETGAAYQVARHPWIDEAIKSWGITYDPQEAGYLLPDGTMLDFSGRAEAGGYQRAPDGTYWPLPGGKDYMAGKRYLDHGDIGRITAPEFGGGGRSAYTGVVDFMKETGAVRIAHLGDWVTVEAAGPLSAAQRRFLQGQADLGIEIVYDLTDPTFGRRITSGTATNRVELGRFFQETEAQLGGMVREPPARYGERRFLQDLPIDQVIDDARVWGLIPAEQAARVAGRQQPEHLAAAIEYLLERRARAIGGEVTGRDAAKAIAINTMSHRAGEMMLETVTDRLAKRGIQLEIPERYLLWKGDIAYVRPEDAAATWLQGPTGRRALDAAEQGIVDREAWGELQSLRQIWGLDTYAIQKLFEPSHKAVYRMDRVNEFATEWNRIAPKVAAGELPTEELDELTRQLAGVGYGKTGFMKHLLGLGDSPTMDAIEVNFWMTGQADVGKLTNYQKYLAQEINERLSNNKKLATWFDAHLRGQLEELRDTHGIGVDLDPEVFYHVMHHWIWDAAKGTETTHLALYDAMRVAEQAMIYDEAVTLGDDVARALEKAGDAGIWPDAEGAQLSFRKYESAPGQQVGLDGRPEPAYGYAKAYQKELVTKGWIDFRGQRVSRRTAARDLAEMFRIYRDPSMETLRVIYVREGELLAHEALTSGAIDLVENPKDWARWAYEINHRADRLGAEDIYLLHNHPSGVPKPSPGDVNVTREIADRVDRLRAHVVIDGHEFYEIPLYEAHPSPKGWRWGERLPVTKQVREPYLPGRLIPWDPFQRVTATGKAQREKLEAIVWSQVNSPEKVAEIARRIHEDGVTVLYLDTQLKVVGFEQWPASWLRRSPGVNVQTLEQHRRAFGARHSAIVADVSYQMELQQIARRNPRGLLDIVAAGEKFSGVQGPALSFKEGDLLAGTGRAAELHKTRRIWEQPAISQWALDQAAQTVDEARRRVETMRGRVGKAGEVGAVTQYQVDQARAELRAALENLQRYIDEAETAGLDVTRARAALVETPAAAPPGASPSPVANARAQPGAAELPGLAELARRVEPRQLEALDRIAEGLRADWPRWEARQVDAATQAEVGRWLQGAALPAFRDARLASVAAAQSLADFGMLNYMKRRNLDEWLSLIYPYHYWYTRSGYNWIKRLAQDPRRLALWLRYQRGMKRIHEDRGLRQRFEGKWRIPAPFLPDWMEQSLYIDPVRSLFPFAQWYQIDWDNEDEAAGALERFYQGMKGAGFRPYAFIEAPAQLAGILGERPENLGHFLPQTRYLQGITALAGVGPAGGVDIEAPIRRALGVPEQEPYGAYRVARTAGSMAADQPGLAIAALRAQELQRAVNEGELELRVATGEADTLSPALEALRTRYNWSPEELAEAQALFQETVRRAGIERGVAAVAGLTGFAAMPLATGERRQMELQEEARRQIWRPETGTGSRAQYEAWRAEHPEIYARSQAYSVLPGEQAGEFTPGYMANVIQRRGQRDQVLQEFDAQMDLQIRTDPGDLYTVGEIRDRKYEALDAIDAALPRPEMEGEYPAAQYGQTPGEYAAAVMDRELRGVSEGLPRRDQYASSDDYQAALQQALAALPETAPWLEMAQKSGATRAFTVREALEQWRRRYDTPIQALQSAYFDLVYWPAMDRYHGQVDAGKKKGEAWDNTVGAIQPLLAGQLVEAVLDRNLDRGWTAEQLANEYQGISFPAGDDIGAYKTPDEREVMGILGIVPYEDPIREEPIIALVATGATRALATPEQIAEARQRLQVWLAEHPDAEQAAAEAQQLEDEASRRWPGIRELQDQYFDLNKAERREFLEQHPELREYWDFKDAWKADHPVYTSYYDPDFDASKAKGDGRRKAESTREPRTVRWPPGPPWWEKYPRRSYAGRSYARDYQQRAPAWRPLWRRQVVRVGL